MAKVELTGMEELLKELYEIGEKVATSAENKALQKGADILQKAVSEMAPRSNLSKAHLADNIVKSGVRTSKEGVKHIVVGPDKKFFYGKFLELGTTKMSAKPFMGPALEEKRNEIYSAMADVLREEIEKRR